MRVLLFFICSLISAATGAQVNLPDTILPVHPASVFVTSIDSIHGEILDTLDHPQAILVQVYGQESYLLKIAFKTRTGYDVFDVFTEEGSEFTFGRFDFNSKGSEELIIHWSDWHGTDCYGGGFSENTSGVVVWDLDKRQMLLSYENYMWSYTWSEVYEFDEGDTSDSNAEYLITGIFITEEDTFIFDNPVEITRKSIQITVNEAPDENTEGSGEAQIETTLVTYDWKKGQLIRRK